MIPLIKKCSVRKMFSFTFSLLIVYFVTVASKLFIDSVLLNSIC